METFKARCRNCYWSDQCSSTTSCAFYTPLEGITYTEDEVIYEEYLKDRQAEQDDLMSEWEDNK